jgi:hypothetical protein
LEKTTISHNKPNQFSGRIRVHAPALQRLSEAEGWIQKAIETHKRDSMMWYLGRDYILYGNLLNRKGARLKAKENLIKAIETFKECGADGWVKRTEKTLDSLS